MAAVGWDSFLTPAYETTLHEDPLYRAADQSSRPTVNSGLALGLHNWMIASAIVLVIVSAYFWNPIPLIIAIFLGVVGFAERHAGPNLAAAIKAYDTIKPALGEVSISVSSGDSQDHHHAVAIAYGQPDWSYEFVPQNWQPKAGRHAAVSGAHPMMASRCLLLLKAAF